METGGAFSKPTMGGPSPSEAVRVTTSSMTRLLAYEPADLTISVEAGRGSCTMLLRMAR